MNEKNISTDFESFLVENRNKINQSFNSILWVCIAAGPLIAVAVYFKVFAGVTYLTALIVSLFMFALALIHKALMKHRVASFVTCIVALFAIDCLLIVMDSAHLTIYISWFLIPLLSLQFCDFKLYFVSVAVNYCFMVFATWHMAPYFAERRTDVDTPLAYFLSRIGGLTVEMMVMICAGYVLCKMILRYYQNLIEKAAVVSRDQGVLARNAAQLKALAGNYLWVEDIDISENTFELIVVNDERVEEYLGDTRTNAKQLIQSLLNLLAAESCKKEVVSFVDFSTLDSRMADQSAIEFSYENESGQKRLARFIVSGRGKDGRISHVIWLVEDVG